MTWGWLDTWLTMVYHSEITREESLVISAGIGVSPGYLTGDIRWTPSFAKFCHAPLYVSPWNAWQGSHWSSETAFHEFAKTIKTTAISIHFSLFAGTTIGTPLGLYHDFQQAVKSQSLTVCDEIQNVSIIHMYRRRKSTYRVIIEQELQQAFPLVQHLVRRSCLQGKLWGSAHWVVKLGTYHGNTMGLRGNCTWYEGIRTVGWPSKYGWLNKV